MPGEVPLQRRVRPRWLTRLRARRLPKLHSAQAQVQRAWQTGFAVGPVTLSDDGREDLLACEFALRQPRSLHDVLGLCIRSGCAQLPAAQVTTEPELALAEIGLNEFLDVQEFRRLDDQASLFPR